MGAQDLGFHPSNALLTTVGERLSDGELEPLKSRNSKQSMFIKWFPFTYFSHFFKINKTFRHIQVKHIILQSAVTFPPHSQESHKALSSNQKDAEGNPRSLPLATRANAAVVLPS